MEDTPDRLEKLWGHLGNMTPDQIRETIRKVRADRRLTKPKAATKAKAKVSADSARVKLKGMLKDMDDATLKRLLGDG